MQPFRTLAVVIGASLLLAVAAPASAQTKPARIEAARSADPFRPLDRQQLLLLQQQHAWPLQRAGQCRRSRGKYRGTSVTVSGSGLDWHDVASYLQPDGIGKYSFVPDNKIVFNPPGRQFDAVIMMDCSQCPIHPQLEGAFRDAAKKDAAIVKKYGAQPMLFMSWAYKDVPEMTAQLAEQYTLAGNANDALVIPAGLAFAKAVSKRPSLELYQPDKRHPTLAGTYLAACTTYAAIQRVAGRQCLHGRARPGARGIPAGRRRGDRAGVLQSRAPVARSGSAGWIAERRDGFIPPPARRRVRAARISHRWQRRPPVGAPRVG